MTYVYFQYAKLLYSFVDLFGLMYIRITGFRIKEVILCYSSQLGYAWDNQQEKRVTFRITAVRITAVWIKEVLLCCSSQPVHVWATTTGQACNISDYSGSD